MSKPRHTIIKNVDNFEVDKALLGVGLSELDLFMPEVVSQLLSTLSEKIITVYIYMMLSEVYPWQPESST